MDIEPEKQPPAEPVGEQSSPQKPEEVSRHSPEGIYKKFEQQREAAGDSAEGRLKAAREAVKALQDYVGRQASSFEKMTNGGPDILAEAAQRIGMEHHGEVLEMLKAGNQALLKRAKNLETQVGVELKKLEEALVRESKFSNNKIKTELKLPAKETIDWSKKIASVRLEEPTGSVVPEKSVVVAAPVEADSQSAEEELKPISEGFGLDRLQPEAAGSEDETLPPEPEDVFEEKPEATPVVAEPIKPPEVFPTPDTSDVYRLKEEMRVFDLEDLQAIHTQVAADLAEMGEQDPKRSAKEKRAHAILDVLIEKENALAKDFIKEYEGKGDAFLTKKTASLEKKRNSLIIKLDKFNDSDAKGDKYRIDLNKLNAESLAVNILLNKKSSELLTGEDQKAQPAAELSKMEQSKSYPASARADEPVPGSEGYDGSVDLGQGLNASVELRKQERNAAASAADFLLKRIDKVGLEVKKEIKSAVALFLESQNSGDVNSQSESAKKLLKIYARELKASLTEPKTDSSSARVEVTRPTFAPKNPVESAAIGVEGEEEDTVPDVLGVEYAKDGTVIDPNSPVRKGDRTNLVGADRLSDAEAARIKKDIENNFIDPSEATPNQRTLVEAEWESDDLEIPVGVEVEGTVEEGQEAAVGGEVSESVEYEELGGPLEIAKDYFIKQLDQVGKGSELSSRFKLYLEKIKVGDLDSPIEISKIRKDVSGQDVKVKRKEPSVEKYFRDIVQQWKDGEVLGINEHAYSPAQKDRKFVTDQKQRVETARKFLKALEIFKKQKKSVAA